MKIYKRTEKLPQDNQYVLGHYCGGNWNDKSVNPEGQNWVVVKFVKGMSAEYRASLPFSDQRKRVYSAADEQGNNNVAYYWIPFGPGSYFGQHIDVWTHLPNYENE